MNNIAVFPRFVHKTNKQINKKRCGCARVAIVVFVGLIILFVQICKLHFFLGWEFLTAFNAEVSKGWITDIESLADFIRLVKTFWEFLRLEKTFWVFLRFFLTFSWAKRCDCVSGSVFDSVFDCGSRSGSQKVRKSLKISHNVSEVWKACECLAKSDVKSLEVS